MWGIIPPTRPTPNPTTAAIAITRSRRIAAHMGHLLARPPVKVMTNAPDSSADPTPINSPLFGEPSGSEEDVEARLAGPRYCDRNSRSWDGNSTSLMQAAAGLANPMRARQ